MHEALKRKKGEKLIDRLFYLNMCFSLCLIYTYVTQKEPKWPREIERTGDRYLGIIQPGATKITHVVNRGFTHTIKPHT